MKKFFFYLCSIIYAGFLGEILYLLYGFVTDIFLRYIPTLSGTWQMTILFVLLFVCTTLFYSLISSISIWLLYPLIYLIHKSHKSAAFFAVIFIAFQGYRIVAEVWQIYGEYHSGWTLTWSIFLTVAYVPIFVSLVLSMIKLGIAGTDDE